MKKNHTFCIAEHTLSITFGTSSRDDISLLPSFEPFRTEKADNDGCLFSLEVKDHLEMLKPDEKTTVGEFDTGNGKIGVDNTADGGYQYTINDIHGNCCCLLQTNANFSKAVCTLNGTTAMRRFGLNNALMLTFAFSASFFDTLLIHASLVRNRGYGYAFTAKSGTGKSTHTSLWMKYIEGCDLMNDDNPIVRIVDGTPYIYGSPWSGKTSCYRNTKAPLGAITKIERDTRNYVEKTSPAGAFGCLLPACSSMRWDKAVFNNTCNTVTKLIEAHTRIFILHCRPDEEAARICYNSIAANNKND